MGRKGTSYERELKGILEGDSEVIHKISNFLDDSELENYKLLIDSPFFVVRAAGSFGVDLVAIKEDISFPIEVKASSSKKISFSHAMGRAQLQYIEFRKICSRSGVIMLYAFRLKRAVEDPWRIFCLDCEPIKTKLKVIYEFLPKVEHTSQGYVILNWEHGKPLNKFIEFIVKEVLY